MKKYKCKKCGSINVDTTVLVNAIYNLNTEKLEGIGDICDMSLGIQDNWCNDCDDECEIIEYESSL